MEARAILRYARISPRKVQIVLDAFCELGLLKNENGCYSAVENAAKVSLGSSELLRRLGYCD